MTWLFLGTPHEPSDPAQAFTGEIVDAGFSPPYGYSSVSYSVDFGDGTPPSAGTTTGLPAATHEYTLPGTYTVTATQDAWFPTTDMAQIVVALAVLPPDLTAGSLTSRVIFE